MTRDVQCSQTGCGTNPPLDWRPTPFLQFQLSRMSKSTVYFVGTHAEVAHHAAPLRTRVDLQIVEPDDVLKLAKPGDLAIFYSEHFDRFRHACQQLQTQQVATLYMIDGILEWRNAWVNRSDEVACPYTMRPVLADKVACIGNSQARVLETWGNVGKTEVVGIPRLDGFADRFPRTNLDSAKFRVLIMTAKSPAFTEQQYQAVRRGLEDLKFWLADNVQLDDGRQVEFDWRLTGDLADEIGVTNQLANLTGGDLAQALAKVDAVITTPSTAMLEAMLLDIPVALLDYHNCPHYVSAAWDICSAEHIAPTLQQLSDPPETRMVFQRNQLGDAMQRIENASDRLVELISAMLELAAEQIDSDRSSTTLKFPAQILSSRAATPTEFNHQRLFPVAPEFANQDRTVLQIELSHARREIDHLHRQLAQAHSELDQAHQIFEQINNHPIAGPIVRIRQKMLDLMSAIRKRKNDIESTPAVPAPDSPPSLGESSSK